LQVSLKWKEKSNKNQWLKPSCRRQNGRPKDMEPTRTKEGRKLVPLVVGNNLTHNLFNVACIANHEI
jgi:hypothetical protein